MTHQAALSQKNFFKPVLTPRKLALLMQKCPDSLSPGDLHCQICHHKSSMEWSLPPFPELSLPLAGNPFIHSSLPPPIVSDPTIYWDGYGNPMVPVAYCPFDSSAGYDTYLPTKAQACSDVTSPSGAS
ncbi:uncharacterized protein VP01_3759g3 [Puccinia sorghi]|uniref:Uncharacterized protein n=1 Tax=Puccinia sorghi TaxID=27349 RepID=A0A0L6UTS2_9BASI|nr:uncharacterized protein VP01_3759g3 [Puccinia sorghi]